MLRRFQNIRAGTLTAHLAVTLAYPVYKALSAPRGALLAFTDALTVIALVLTVCGIVYALALRGDLDVSGYVFRRGLWGDRQSYRTYRANRKEEREAAFNYPLFLGLVYLLAAGVLAYGVL